MAILSLQLDFAGQVGLNPRRGKMVSTDSLATITTAGYLNNANLQGILLLPTDVIDVIYNYVSANSPGTYAELTVSISNNVITLNAAQGSVILPVTSGDFAVFSGTAGAIADLGYLPSNAAKTVVSMLNGAVILNHIATYKDTSGTIGNDAATAINGGNIQAGLSGTAGQLASFPATASNGSFIFKAINNSGGFNSTFSNSNIGQATVYSLPDPGAATANILLDTGTNASGTFTTLTATTANITNLKYGATPVPQVDPASCTITAAAGAANHCTITIQLKDGSGTNMSRVIPFKVYLATDATGLTLQTAASTGYSVTSGGVKDPTGSTTITQGLAAFSSATGGCVVDLLDTGKGTGNLILMLPNGFKASAAVTSGSYG